jgi:chemotaxis protein methyltransferase CheR
MPNRPIDWQEVDSVRPLAPAEFDEIRQLAHRTFGLDLKPGKEEMVSARLRRLVRDGGFHSFRDYTRHIVNDSTGAALASMIDALATNHTAFLREPSHFYFFRDYIIPLLAKREPIEVWCAACATGEEAWTLSFLLTDALPGRAFRLLATDISNKALSTARSALYTTERCGPLPASWIGRYLKPEALGYRVVPEIRRQVTFRRFNLTEGPAARQTFPVIFCRNVMIYFDAQSQERVIAQLSDCLEPGGYLFVGHAESLARIAHGLDYVQPAIYRKPLKREVKWTKSW